MSIPPWVTHIRANNPGHMTLSGTNSYILDLGDECLLVDPGPPRSDHIEALTSAVAGRPTTVLLTHRHADHSDALPEIVERIEPRAVIAGSLKYASRLPRITTSYPTNYTLGDVTLQICATPGHTEDSICALAMKNQTSEAVLITGDTALGEGSSVIAAPDGNVGDYLTSLGRLLRTLEAAPDAVALPGHGPAGGNALELVTRYAAHRLARIAEVHEALRKGTNTVIDLTEAIYPHVPDQLRGVASASIDAHRDFVIRSTSEHS